MKRCFKCGLEKPRSEFYRHPQMADGLLGKCKDCTKVDMRVDRLTKPRVREYDRRRATQPHRMALRGRVTREWRAKHPSRVRAHVALERAVKNGDVKKPTTCQLCGIPNQRIEGHHVDYAYPLAVLWVCKPCHATADKVRRMTESVMSQLPF